MKITIDGVGVPLKEGQTILDAARDADIYIPTLCAHKELPPFGACRLCIVKVDDMRGFPPACSTPARDGMIIHSEEEDVIKLRRNILKLILIEHPHSCIVCNIRNECEDTRGGPVKAGRITGCSMCPNRPTCEIREVCEHLDMADMDIPMEYKNLPLERYDPFYDRDYNLCILCGRCVRMCQLVRGVGAIAFTERSHKTKVGTIFGRTHLEGDCRFCGACIDVCPTGALTPKGSKWHGKPDRSIESICGLCSLNCGMILEEKWGKIMAALPDRRKEYSRAYACVYGRFCIPPFLNGLDRLTYPLIRKGGRMTPVSWGDAFEFISSSLQRFGPEEIGFMVSPYITNESGYLISKLSRDVLQTHNIDLLSRFGRSVMQYYAKRGDVGFNWPTLDEVEKAKWIMLVNNDILFTHPGMPVAIHKARENGARIIILDDAENSLDVESDIHIRIEPGSLRTFLSALSKLLVSSIDPARKEEIEKFVEFQRSLFPLKLIDAVRLTGVLERDFDSIKEILLSSKNGVILAGSRIMEDPIPDQILGQIENILLLLDIERRFLPLLEEGNVRGLIESGCLNGYRPGPSRDRAKGKDYLRMITGIRRGDVKALFINEASVSPEQIRGAKFVVLSEIYPSDLDPIADVILPTAAFTEENGHFTSLEGQRWKLQKAAEPHGGLQEWQIVARIGKALGSSEFEYENVEEIEKELEENMATLKGKDRSVAPTVRSLFPVIEPGEIHLMEHTPYVARYRGTPIHLMVDDLKTYLEENQRISKEDTGIDPGAPASGFKGVKE